MRHQILVEIPREHRTPMLSQTLYEFDKNLGYVKLQKALFWLLDKIGARQKYEAIAYTRVAINTEEFEKAIGSQMSYIADKLNTRPNTVLMGPLDFMKLAHSDKLVVNMVPFGFTAETEVHKIDKRGHTKKVFGLDCYVIPWMDGILVLPPGHYIEENF